MSLDLSLKSSAKMDQRFVRTFPDVTLPVIPLRYLFSKNNMKIIPLSLTPRFSKVWRSRREVPHNCFNSFRASQLATFNFQPHQLTLGNWLVTVGNHW